jgi:hypothetical protein
VRFIVISAISVVVLFEQAGAWEMRSLPLRHHEMRGITSRGLRLIGECVLDYRYLIEDCGYVTVVGEIEQDETFGVHFNMTDSVGWYAPCDTGACQTLDIIDLVFYDVLAPPGDQGLNLKVFGADNGGEPVGGMLGNCDFEPFHADTATITTTRIDFTNGGTEPGLDLSGCGGNFVVLVTWKNSTGHPLLVLDNVSTCLDSCTVNAACCEMGLEPYGYPRSGTHTYFYGTEGAWSKQDSLCDPGGCGPYGYLEAVWTCGFCGGGTATAPTSWGAIKALYR